MIEVLETVPIARSQPHLPHVNLEKGSSLESLPEDVLEVALKNGWVKISDEKPEPEPEPTPEPEPAEEPKAEEAPKSSKRGAKK